MSLAIKRLFDVLASVCLLTASLPLQAVIAVVVRTNMGSPVLFRQARPGLEGRTFELLKFRTMRPEDPRRGWTDDDSRLTDFGRWLRSTSLDELPSLWNVVRGDMSLVGPRPLLVGYLDLYSAAQSRRHSMRPGLTGLAQVSGRNRLGWSERLEMDVQYVDTWSLVLDLRILLRTATTVLRRDGISEEGGATMTPFRGNEGEDEGQ